MNKLRGILISTAILSGVLLTTEGVSAKDNHLFVIQTFAQKPISEKDFNESDVNSEKESALKKIQEMNLKDRVSEFNERIESGYTRAEISKILDEAKSVSDSNNKSDDEAKQKEEEKKRKEKEQAEKAEKEKTKQTSAESTTPSSPGKDYASLAASRAGNEGLQPQTAKFKEEIIDVFGITNIGGYRPGDPEDHGTGHAIDVMVPAGSELGDRVAQYAINNANRAGIKYIIWKQRFWAPFYSIYGPAYSWNIMGDRGGDTANHYDHVHISFN